MFISQTTDLIPWIHHPFEASIVMRSVYQHQILFYNIWSVATTSLALLCCPLSTGITKVNKSILAAIFNKFNHMWAVCC